VNINKFVRGLSSILPTRMKALIRVLLPVRVKRFISYLVMRSVDTNSIVTMDDGRKFKVIKDGLFMRVLYEGEYEPLLSSIAKFLIKNGDNVVDIGANFGWYTTLFASLSSSGKVYSYEPSPYASAILRDNVELNDMRGGVKIREVGVGSQSSIELIDTSNSGLAHIVHESNNTTTQIKVVSLDDDLSDLVGKIAYIKIDIEGFEFFALQGAINILTSTDQPIIQIEVNDDALERSGSSRNQLVKFLSKLGYRFYEAKSEGKSLVHTDAKYCSDMFCVGNGQYSGRIDALI